MWIILLQARKFSKGQMDPADPDTTCLGEFINLKHHLLAKSCAGLNHEDMPDELKLTSETNNDQQGKRDLDAMLQALTGDNNPNNDKNKRNRSNKIRQPHNEKMSDFLQNPMQQAGGVSLDQVCTYCGITKAALIPNFDLKKDCAVHFLFGTCKFGDNCIYNHKAATHKQITTIQDKLQKFLKDPQEMKALGKKN